MPRRFLIDGYNLLHAFGLPKKLGAGGLERARQRLLAFISQNYPEAHSTVVFDGKQASGPINESGIAVLFSKGEADDLIRDLLRQDSAPKSLCVVSSDHAVQTAAKRRHAVVMDADVFLAHLESRPVPLAPEPDKPPMAVEMQHWLEAFGDIERDPAVRKMQEIEPLGSRGSKKRRKR